MVMTEQKGPRITRRGVAMTATLAVLGYLVVPVLACPPSENPVKADKAAKAFQDLQDGWAAVYYSADDLPQNQQDVCRRWMGTYDKKVSKWLKKAKALKELSIATAGN